MPQAGNFEGSPVSEIIQYALDTNVLKSAIGVATLNALSQLIVESGNGTEYEIIIERDGFEMKYFKPESEMREALEKSRVIIMTGTAIVNHTVDHILSLLKNGIRVGIIGPTASIVPDAFFKRGVDVMAGVKILDPNLMIKILKQGGSAYHLLQRCSQKIAFMKK